MTDNICYLLDTKTHQYVPKYIFEKSGFVITCPLYTKPKDALHCSQQLSTAPCPAPGESSLQPAISVASF